MAVPTGYQHQDRGKFLIYISKIFSGVTATSIGYVLGLFLVHFWYVLGTRAPTLPREKTLPCLEPEQICQARCLLYALLHMEFFCLSRITIYIFFTAVWRKAPNAVSTYLRCCCTITPATLNFTVLAAISRQNLIKMKANKRYPIWKYSRTGHSRKQNIRIPTNISWVRVED